MHAVRKALAPLRRGLFLFFRSHLRLRLRGGLRLEFVNSLGDRPPTPEELALRHARQELAQMLQELGQVLSDERETRDQLRHLAYAEQVLRTHGLAALDKMPLEVLERAWAQFEGLVSDWSPWGLATLRSKMAVAVVSRGGRRGDEVQGTDPAPSERGGRVTLD